METQPKHNPLSVEQLEELSTAAHRAEKILGAARVAAMTGWSVGTFGVLSILFGLRSPAGLLVGGALLAVAWNELEGRKLLRRFHRAGPRRLARNQLWLLAVIAAYCLWAIHKARAAPPSEIVELEALLELEEGFMSGLTTATYAAVLGVAVIYQWAMVRYHERRIKLLDSFVAETPSWIVGVLKVVGGSSAGTS